MLSHHLTWAILILYLAKHDVEIYSLFSSKVQTQNIVCAEHFMGEPCDTHTELRDLYLHYYALV